MLNRKDLLGGVVLGTALSCVLFVGAVTTSANAFTHGNHSAAPEASQQLGNASVNGAERTAPQR